MIEWKWCCEWVMREVGRTLEAVLMLPQVGMNARDRVDSANEIDVIRFEQTHDTVVVLLLCCCVVLLC